MKVIALTGGIASGKSTVAQCFTDMGLKVIDADMISREVVQRGEKGLEMLVAAFGEQILQGNGELNRAALGQIVFFDSKKLEQLNQIMHPLIGQRAHLYFDKLEQAGEKYCIYEIPLLFEKQMQAEFDGHILVYIPLKLQIARLKERDQCSEVVAMEKIHTQMSLEKKIQLAEYTIDNSGLVTELCQKTSILWETIKERLY